MGVQLQPETPARHWLLHLFISIFNRCRKSCTWDIDDALLTATAPQTGLLSLLLLPHTRNRRALIREVLQALIREAAALQATTTAQPVQPAARRQVSSYTAVLKDEASRSLLVRQFCSAVRDPFMSDALQHSLYRLPVHDLVQIVYACGEPVDERTFLSVGQGDGHGEGEGEGDCCCCSCSNDVTVSSTHSDW